VPRPYTQEKRADLRPPHPLPFLLIDDTLICPWPRRPILLTWQSDQLREARACLALVPHRLPRYAWVSAAKVVPIPQPEECWIARRSFDGMKVPAYEMVEELAAA
jgi:hypothetical protein